MVQGVDHCDDRRHQMRPFRVVTCLALLGVLLPRQLPAALGDEAGTDASPTAVEGINSPMHVLALVAMGMPLVENLDLEELARQAAAHDRWTFLFVLAPLDIRGSTGSAVNPIAVF
jgi:hypothetical protein